MVPQTFLWWANPAVAVNDYTQSIFSPDVHAVFDHGKRDVSKFPIATGTYYKMDYSDGVDISRYKNLPVPTSYMAYHSDYNFVGGYDFSVDAGILHIANHHISPGKKQWTWGNGDFGQAWDRNLTDEDGPYIELMTGVYTDNQPDFTWLEPKESKTFKQYFMPYKSVGGVKNASLDGMINLEIKDGEAYLALYVPSSKNNLKIELKENNKVIFSEQIDEITPVKAFEHTMVLAAQLDESAYRLVVYEGTGKELISYQAKENSILETPDPAKAPVEPEEMASCEELFLTGLHIEQYRHATYLPEDYYLEGLKREPDDIRNNNAYGLLMFRRGRFEVAESHFRKAIKTLTKRNPNPYDSEPFYNLGLALRKQGQYEEAYGAFYKATWNGAYQNNGYYEIACIDIINDDYEQGLEHITKSIVRNGHDIKARGVKTALLRKMNLKKEAVKYAGETLEIDSTSFAALYELYKLGCDGCVDDDVAIIDLKNNLVKMLRDNHQNYIELALDYGHAGFFEDVVEIMEIYREQSNKEYPMIDYIAGYYSYLSGNKEQGSLFYERGNAASQDYCFPHRLDELIVLTDVLIHSNHANPLYYLGNLYYDKRQYDIAIDLWQQSVESNPRFATSARNLALAFVNKRNDVVNGLKYLEIAFMNNDKDARVLFELDQLYKKLNYSYTKRLETLEKYMPLVTSRDDLFVEYLTVLNNVEQFEKVKVEIDARIFHPWEGGEGKVSSQYKRCRIELAKRAILSKAYDEAIKLLEESKVYPHNLGEGKLANAAENDIDYFIGLAYEKMDNMDKAKAYYQIASFGIDEPTDAMYYNDQPADMMFYQGLALRKLGDEKASKSEFNRMFDFGEKHIYDEVKIDYFAVSLPDFLVFDEDLNVKNLIHCKYLMALGYLGKGDVDIAKDYLKEVYEMNINHQGVLTHMNLDLNLVK